MEGGPGRSGSGHYQTDEIGFHKGEDTVKEGIQQILAILRKTKTRGKSRSGAREDQFIQEQIGTFHYFRRGKVTAAGQQCLTLLPIKALLTRVLHQFLQFSHDRFGIRDLFVGEIGIGLGGFNPERIYFGAGDTEEDHRQAASYGGGLDQG